MSYYFSDISGFAIVKDNAKAHKQPFGVNPLGYEDPMAASSEYVKWIELNPNHIGSLNGGDRVIVKDSDGFFFELYIQPKPNMGGYSLEFLQEQMKKIDNMQKKNREEYKKKRAMKR